MDWYGLTLYCIGCVFGIWGMLRHQSAELEGIHFWFSYLLVLMGTARVCYHWTWLLEIHFGFKSNWIEYSIFTFLFLCISITSIIGWTQIVHFLLRKK